MGGGSAGKQGYSIVKYDDEEKNQYVHLIDEEHHVSKGGNQVDAWILLPNDAGNVGSGVERQAEPLRGATACDDDEDRPLWDMFKTGSGVWRKAAAPGDAAGRRRLCSSVDDDAKLPGGSSSSPAS